MPFLKETQFVPSSYSSPVRVQRCRAICMRSHMLVFGGGHGELQDQVLRPSYLVCFGTTPPNRQGCGVRVSADVLRFMPHINVGTMWGPHALRDCERSARLCTSRTAGNRPHTRGGHGNVLPRFTGGQVVAGSNPVSPTQVRGTFRRFGRCPYFCSIRQPVRQPGFAVYRNPGALERPGGIPTSFPPISRGPRFHLG
jgi:hypothetical protein